MCVGFWSLEHPDYALILCTNRDEYLSRPTSTAHFHNFGSLDEADPDGFVLSGRDLAAGGTWLGINRDGRVAFLTNITEAYGTYSSSRGHLLSGFLAHRGQGSESAGGATGGGDGDTFAASVREITERGEPYAGFNLLLLDPVIQKEGTIAYEGAYVTNHGGGGALTSRPLSADERACAGLSNGVDGRGAGQWPKVRAGIGRLHELLSEPVCSPENELVEQLFSLLQWRSELLPQDRAGLRNTIRIDPILISEKKPQDTSSSSSSANHYYGTRLSTVILVRRTDRRVLFVERDIWKVDGAGGAREGDRSAQRVFEFTV